MNYNKIIICMFLIIIPLILLILYYRNYVYQYCKNDMKCAKEKLILNLDNLMTSLKIKYFDIDNKIQKKDIKKVKKEDKDNQIREESMEYEEDIIDQETEVIENEEELIETEEEYISEEDRNIYDSRKNRNYNNIVYEENNERYENTNVIEGFFGGLDGWFPGSTPSKAPVLPGTLPDENLNLLEKKINNKLLTSNKFPPEELHGNSDDFKDSNNNDILNQSNIASGTSSGTPSGTPSGIQSGTPSGTPDNIPVEDKYNHNINKIPIEKKEIKNFQDIKGPILNKQDTKNPVVKDIPPPPPQQDIKSLFNSCQFFNDKCPDDYFGLGNFSIQGNESNNILSCGNVQNTKPAHAIAQIKNNSIYEIHITDPGHGFNPASSPKVSIEGGKGHGATAEAVIDDDGFLKLIKVINPGYNYTETPKVLIQAPFMNSSCHLCCKNNPI